MATSKVCGSPASCAALLLLSGGGDSRYIAASFIELNVRPRKLQLRVVGSTYGILSDFPISPFAHLPKSRLFGVVDDKNDNSKERQIKSSCIKGVEIKTVSQMSIAFSLIMSE